MPFAEHLDLAWGKLYASQALLVESLTFRIDKFQPPAFRAVLQRRVERLSVLWSHAVHIYRLPFLECINLVGCQFDTFYLIWNIHILLPYGHQFIGVLVDGNETGCIGSSVQVQFRYPSHVSRLPEMLLVLFCKNVSEVWSFQFRFLADTVNPQTDLSVRHGYEWKTRVQLDFSTCQGQGERNQLVCLVSFQHGIQQSLLFEWGFRDTDLFQCLPVHHVFVVTVAWSLLLLRLRSLYRLLCFFLWVLLFCHSLFFFFVLTLFPVFSRTDFVAFEKFLHCIRFFALWQILDCLLVLLVIMNSHAYEPEMCRFFELAPEILDKVFEDTGVLFEF